MKSLIRICLLASISLEKLKLIAREKPEQLLILRAMQEGHAELIADLVLSKMKIRLPQPILYPRYKKSDMLNRCLIDMFRFVYEESENFFKVLYSSGKNELVEKVLRDSPPWLHYIRYPDIYLNDCSTSMLEVYNKLSSVIEEPPEKEKWKIRMTSHAYDIEFGSLQIKSSNEEFESLNEKIIAQWGVGFQNIKNEKSWIHVFLARFKNNSSASRYFTCRLNSIKKTSKDKGILAIEKVDKSEISPVHIYVSKNEQKFHTINLFSVIEDWFVEIRGKCPSGSQRDRNKKNVKIMLDRIVTLRNHTNSKSQ